MFSNNDWQERKNKKTELESFICAIAEIIIATPTVCEPVIMIKKIKTSLFFKAYLLLKDS